MRTRYSLLHHISASRQGSLPYFASGGVIWLIVERLREPMVVKTNADVERKWIQESPGASANRLGIG